MHVWISRAVLELGQLKPWQLLLYIYTRTQVAIIQMQWDFVCFSSSAEIPHTVTPFHCRARPNAH